MYQNVGNLRGSIALSCDGTCCAAIRDGLADGLAVNDLDIYPKLAFLLS
jgi:hypothetical protein